MKWACIPELVSRIGRAFVFQTLSGASEVETVTKYTVSDWICRKHW